MKTASHLDELRGVFQEWILNSKLSVQELEQAYEITATIDRLSGLSFEHANAWVNDATVEDIAERYPSQKILSRWPEPLLYTPYPRAVRIFQKLFEFGLPQDGNVIDLGSGMGRLGLVAGLLFPKLYFTGFEIEAGSHEEAQSLHARWNLSETVQFRRADITRLSAQELEADAYILYDTLPTEKLERFWQVILSTRKKIASKIPKKFPQFLAVSGITSYEFFENESSKLSTLKERWHCPDHRFAVFELSI